VSAMNVGVMQGWNWDALSAISTFLAVLVALGLGLWPILNLRRKEKKQAGFVRQQVYTQLSAIQPHLASRNTSLPPVALRAIHALESLWAKAHLLEVEEFQALGRTVTALIPHRDGWGFSADQASPLFNQAFETRKLLAGPLGIGFPDPAVDQISTTGWEEKKGEKGDKSNY